MDIGHTEYGRQLSSWKYCICSLLFTGNKWNLTCLDLSPCPLTADLQHWNNYFVFTCPVYPQVAGIIGKVGILSIAGCACDWDLPDFFYKCLLILCSLSNEWCLGENLGLTSGRIMLPAASVNRNCVPLQGFKM